MDTLSLFRRVFLLFASSCFLFFAGAQNEAAERALINAYSLEANKLIWHLNLNVKKMMAYQEKLNVWYGQSSQTVKSAPVFVFSPQLHEMEILALLKDKSIAPNNSAFNYQRTLAELYKQSVLFDSFCKQTEKISRSTTKEVFYQQNLSNFYQLDNMAEDLVNLCYDFSLSCAINYGKEKLPVELDRLKNVVGQAKNVIMSIRENNIIQAKSYLNQLNIAIAASSEDEKFNDLRRVGKFRLDEFGLKEKHDQILEAANQIAFWGEQYVQSNFKEEEVQSLLQSAILAFNVFEGKAGCSGAYNELISFSSNEFLYFTEEPMFFKVKRVSPPELPKTELLSTEKKQTVLKKDSAELQSIQKIKAFDPNDLNSLDGALPNNLIIMMDVSASMKLTGKLPLLKSSIIHLLGIMRPEDRISLIAYSGKSEVLIAGAGIENKAELRTVLDTLHSSGGTDIENGLVLAYETAKQNFMPKGNNRVIIVTDGEFGVKGDILKLAQEQALKGFALSVFQFNEAKDYSKNNTLQVLAETGRGSYQIITSSDEALEILIKEVKKR